MAANTNAVVFEKKLDEKFPIPESGYTDQDFDDITFCLERIPKWKEYRNTPQIFALLRHLNELDNLNSFANLSDSIFPIDMYRLPKDLGPGFKLRFRDSQGLVCDKSDAVQLIGKRKHMNFEEAPACLIEEKILARGPLSTVQKVSCTLDLNLYVRKQYERKQFVAEDSQVRQHFENEVQNMKGIVHRHCVELVRALQIASSWITVLIQAISPMQVASYTDPDFYAFVMSPCADDILTTYLDAAASDEGKKSYLPQFFGCLAQALLFIHNSGYRHRDIKSENILVHKNQPFFTDFDSSINWAVTKRSTTTKDHRHTERWAAPEVGQIRFRKRNEEQGKANTKSDVFSLGCVFLEIITVIKSRSVKQLEDRFEDEEMFFRLNLSVIAVWIKELREIRTDRRHDKVLDWIPFMLKENLADRWTAAALVEETYKEPHREYFSCKKCSGENKYKTATGWYPSIKFNNNHN